MLMGEVARMDGNAVVSVVDGTIGKYGVPFACTIARYIRAAKERRSPRLSIRSMRLSRRGTVLYCGSSG